ncbi:helix-turn-helix domain-containing protein [Leptolyngbya sp. AN03gr2]|uniref:helix-turn-helix domain-containing protein n=1 Tax=unclassified Leptolyngbya TaxID=2650499 RepID=UPI003D313BF7
MNDQSRLMISCTHPEDLLQTASFHFLKTYDIGVSGIGVCHAAQPGCESLEMVFQQHVLFIHLRPEVGSERRIDDRWQEENVQLGDIAIVPAGATHWQGIEQDIAEGIMLTLEPEFLAQSSPDFINLDRIELLPTFAQPDPLIYGIGTTLKNGLATGTCDRIYAETLLASLSVHLLRHYCTQPLRLQSYEKGGLSIDKLQQAIDYIQANLDQKLTLEAISQQLDLSVYYFCELFKQSTGVAPYKYVLQQRVERAKRLLKDKNRAIADIALECGFANQTHLNRHFRKFTGTTPKIYRNR